MSNIIFNQGAINTLKHHIKETNISEKSTRFALKFRLETTQGKTEDDAVEQFLMRCINLALIGRRRLNFLHNRCKLRYCYRELKKFYETVYLKKEITTN